ncbi:Flp pilus assembly protein CpaB [Pontivivens insulae]|uniref:SAF domain-containing protein n=1 Tax=Pontivivens insulae TaxID=1639689 RepID=A0A2R8A8Q7_9RHOB|nr:Flp pilus assembly protein CpaB [Pontivivens insulae]RED18716.1 pilus assembly protein CpaB [Pontivivens insulae]SPF28614.1 hypothetical protein POI8812_00916 [Pontivivens insulae]
MRVIFLLVLIVGMGLAGFAVLETKNRFDQYNAALAQANAIAQEQNANRVELVQVAVATRRLEYGDTLIPRNVEFVDWPADAAPADYFSVAADIFDPEGEDLRLVLRTIEPNEPILPVKITGFGQEAGMAARLGEGFRAFTIRVDVASGVSGFLTPSDRVDVFWSGAFRGQNVTRLIIENLQLIAVDQTDDVQRNRPIVARTITVKATPQQAAILAQAQSSGALSLSLRGLADDSEIGAVEVSLDDVVGYVAPEPVAAPEPEVVAPRRTITVRRGGDAVSTVTAD